MKTVANFFTIFWIIYLPTCIAYNDMPGFSSIDELMTGVLILFTFYVLIVTKKKNLFVNRKPFAEYFVFLCILAFYTVYSLCWGVNVAGGVWLDFIQELRPYSIIFCTWILNPQFSKRQKRIIVGATLITLFALIIYNPENAIDELTGKHVEYYVLGQLAINSAMVFYLFSEPTKRNKIITLAIACVGMAHPKFKYLGELVCLAVFLFVVSKRFNFKSPKTILGAIALVLLLITVTWSRFDKYYVTGLSDEGIARPMSYKTAFGQIIWDYVPFGPGMGSFACNGAWKYYSPLYVKYDLNQIWGLTSGGGFICDAYYPSLAQYGIVGILLFCWFWKRRLTQMNQIKNIRYYKVAFLCFLCLAIEQVADSTFVSGKGMGFCMLIGLSMNVNRNTSIREKVLASRRLVKDKASQEDETPLEDAEKENITT